MLARKPTLTTMDAEKIICCDKGSDNALAYAAMANNRQSDPMAMMAAMNGGMNGWQNNPLRFKLVG